MNVAAGFQAQHGTDPGVRSGAQVRAPHRNVGSVECVRSSMSRPMMFQGRLLGKMLGMRKCLGKKMLVGLVLY